MIYEIHGDPDTGKSSYILNKIKEEEKLCLYINADFQLQDNIIDSSLYILNTNRIETIKDAVTKLAESIDTIVIDSLPMLINDEGNTDKVITDVQRIISICNRNKIDLYIINQYRTNNRCEEYTYYLSRLRLYYNKRIKVD